jgi:hypothetical protein
VSVSKSTDQGQSWSAPQVVSTSQATTAVFPAIDARNGLVDLAYYGTTASSKDDPSAVWNVYRAQRTNAGESYSQVKVSNSPNHVGVVCTQGIACAPGTRTSKGKIAAKRYYYDRLDLIQQLNPGSSR